MKEVRIGIIGTGIIANSHANRYSNIPGAKIVAACDLVPDRLEEFCNKYKIEHRYADYREMLKRDDLDAIDVCVHNNLHLPLAAAVLRSGHHCYCEKPMAGAYVDALTLNKIAEESGKMLHIQLGRLYGAQTHAAKKLIEAGKLGHLYHARSYGYRRRMRPFADGFGRKEFDSTYWAGHGALYDMGVYHISMMLYLLGDPKLKRVSGKVYQELDMDAARRAESGFDVEELCCGMAYFEDSLTMDILESWAIHTGQFPPCIIAGSKGGIEIDAHARTQGGGVPSTALTYYSEELGYPTSMNLDIANEESRISHLNPSRAYYNDSQGHWIAALRGDCELLPTKDIALSTMFVSEGLFLSSVLNRDVFAEEIPTLCKSIAIKRQETPFGVLEYEF